MPEAFLTLIIANQQRSFYTCLYFSMMSKLSPITQVRGVSLQEVNLKIWISFWSRFWICGQQK